MDMNSEKNSELSSDSSSLSPISSTSTSASASPLSESFPKKTISLKDTIKDHVKLGKNLQETMKGKLKLGAKIVKEGGRKNIFKKEFEVMEGEKLIKASQCYLSTTGGPIYGELFSSNARVAFCSVNPVKFHSNVGEELASIYKVSVPLEKIKAVNQSNDKLEPEKRYIYIVTDDDHEFWFMGFLRYDKAYKSLQKAMSHR